MREEIESVESSVICSNARAWLRPNPKIADQSSTKASIHETPDLAEEAKSTAGPRWFMLKRSLKEEP